MPSPPLATTPSSPYQSYTSPLPEPSILAARSTPTNDDIEAVIKMATAAHPSVDRPLRDTRTQLFVGNLPYRVRWQDLKDLFRRAGTVLRADVSLGPDNRSRGYGTVLLATAEDAGRAIDMFNGYCWQTRVLEVRPDRLGATLDENLNMTPSINSAAPFGQPGLNIPTVNPVASSFDDFPIPIQGNGELLSGGTGMRSLFVGNLPFHIQWQDLKDLFRAAGAVTRADVALGPDGRSRGFGTVTFVTEDGAERARRMFDGYEFNGRPLKVHYDKFAQSSQNIPLIGVSPQATSNSVLAPYDTIPQLASPLSRFEPQLPLDLQRSHLEATSLDNLTPAQLESLLAHPRRLSLTSPSLTSPAALSQSPSHVQSPALLQAQAQALSGHSLNPSVVQSLASSSATHSLSQPHSLTGSPHPISSNVSSSASSVHNFGTRDPLGNASDLTLVTDLQIGTDLKLTVDSLTSRSTSFSSPRPSLSAGSSQTSSFSSCGSRRPNVSAGSSRTDILSEGPSLGFGSQRPSFSSSARPSLGATSVEKPSFGLGGSDRLSFGTANSERPTFGTNTSQRLSMNSTTSQKPSFGASSQRSTAHLSTPFLEDDGPASSSQVSIPGISKPSALRPVTMSLSLPPPKSGTQLGSSGSTSKAHSPPSFAGSIVGNNWTDVSGVGSSESGSARALPHTRTSPPSTSEHTSPRASLLAQSILNAESSASSNSVWDASKAQPVKEPPTSKTNGTVDYITTALGSLGARRANKAQNRLSEEKKKPSTPEYQSQSSSTSPPPQAHGKKSQPSSSHRHPGPIVLPPPTAFALPPGVVFSPHAHPQSPMYHPGYPLSPVHPHPMGSPLHHPMGSPLHHPAHMHSPLHHPGHPQYGTYPHPPMHYGVITPHGLPPITPSMPPFTFLPPPVQPPTQNGQGPEDKGNEAQTHHATQNDGGQNDVSRRETPPQVPQPTHYSHTSPPPHGMQYVPQVPPPMFSPGIPLSPGIMVPISPGMMPPAVSMPMSSVPVPMTPGVALTPGVTMAPGAFWSHAPWINPAVGAPVHAGDSRSEHSHSGAEGYFPPVGQPGGDTGYFPPMSSVADEIFKEGHELGSDSGSVTGKGVHEERESTSRSTSRSQVSSPDPSSRTSQEVGRKGGPQAMKRSTSAQCEGGLPKRNGLLHRESDPEVTTATGKGGTSKEA